MQTTFVVRHAEEEDRIKAYFDDRAQKIRKHLSRFRDDLVYLHGSLERNPHREEFHAALSLYLPSAALHCRERAEDYVTALNKVFLSLVRQIDKHKEKLSKEKRRKER
jgi:ribosomal subunit interface protein